MKSTAKKEIIANAIHHNNWNLQVNISGHRITMLIDFLSNSISVYLLNIAKGAPFCTEITSGRKRIISVFHSLRFGEWL